MVRLVVIVMVCFLAGCASVQPVFTQTDTVTITEVVRDTTLLLQPDTASIKALFECDSLNQVIMTNLAVEQGRKISQVIKWQDRVLTVVAAVDSQSVYLQWKEQHIKESSTVRETVVVKVKEPPWYTKALAYIGAIALIVLVALIIIKLK